MGQTLSYNDNEHAHKSHADTLGLLQRGIDKGTTTSSTPHAHYIGLELLKEFPTAKSLGQSFLKADCTGSGKTPNGRSKVRVIVAVKGGKVVEGEAYLWYHDDRVRKLGPGFFQRAKMFRNM